MLRTWGGGGGSSKFDEGFKSIHRGSMGGALNAVKKTCEEVHMIVKLPAISLQACKFNKNDPSPYQKPWLVIKSKNQKEVDTSQNNAASKKW